MRYSLLAPTPSAVLTQAQFEQQLTAQGAVELSSQYDCSIFQDKLTGQMCRYIGRVLTSPSWGNGETWKIRPFNGATPSDKTALLQVTHEALNKHAWTTKRFTNGTPYQAVTLVRRLADYTGDELVAVTFHPDMLEIELASLNARVQGVLL